MRRLCVTLGFWITTTILLRSIEKIGSHTPKSDGASMHHAPVSSNSNCVPLTESIVSFCADDKHRCMHARTLVCLDHQLQSLNRYDYQSCIYMYVELFDNCTKHPHTLLRRYDCLGNKATSNDPSAGSPTETLLRLLLPLEI